MATNVARGGSAMAARTSAVKQLIANHPDEFNTLLGDAREKAGLPRNAKQDALARKIKRLEDQLAKARAELS
jgi:hypothetical protein